jgi:osmotically-inducible protein OsmY
VRRVDGSKLEIQWWLDRERRRDKFTVLRNDVQLQRAVQDTLLYDPRVRGAKVEVRVRQAAVSLLGNVSSLAAKRAAEHDAENTLGVRRVINYVKVKVSDWPGDPAVTQRAQHALARDSFLADCELQAASHFEKVYLRGEVNTHFEKERAEVVVANVPGALDVVNRITVAARWQPKPDDAIEEDAARRLHWSPFLDADQMTMTVDDGVVTLRGTVDSW